MAVAGTLGGLTLGLAGWSGYNCWRVVGHGVEYAVSHAALDATGASLNILTTSIPRKGGA